MEVIDDFLPSYQFKELQSLLMGMDFPWFYNDSICYEGDGLSQYKHTFYKRTTDMESNYLSIFNYCLSLLRIKELWRIKANARPKSLFKRFSCYHRDDFPCSTTAILYINTNNGYTKFKKGGKVKSVANRIVIFDSDLEHRGVTCTDEQRRVVINFNYV